MNASLQGMRIDPNALHYSQPVLELLDNLKEELMVMFNLDKFIEKKQDEIDECKQLLQQTEAVRLVYEKN